MDMTAYQGAAVKTIQPVRGGSGLVVALLGLVGEAGAVMTAYKKQLRDGPSDPGFRTSMREELGDVLWYLSAVAHHLDLRLDDIATANLSKISDRWRHTPADAIPFDEAFVEQEQLPRTAEFVFTLTRSADEREISVLTCAGAGVGDPITNASHIADGYCFHDVFHLAYAAVLGWSPVLRSLLKRKRRSNPETDEAEDGGRAIAIEEGISALVFAYASRHRYLEGKTHVDNDVLDTIQGMVAHLEVGAHRTADWEKAILVGFDVWRELRRQGGGTVRLDLRSQTLTLAEVDGKYLTETEPADAEIFRTTVATLHGQKDAAYGNSWMRRGELISIMANIARKVDRLEVVAAGVRPTQDESILDTVIDLYVYALKYVTFLADADPDVAASLHTAGSPPGRWSEGPPGLEQLLDTADLSAITPSSDAAMSDVVADISAVFADLERCFTTQDGTTAPATTRARLATALANQGLRLVSVIRTRHPDLYAQFLATWQHEPKP